MTEGFFLCHRFQMNSLTSASARHAFNFNTHEAEEGDSSKINPCLIYVEFQANLSYIGKSVEEEKQKQS